MHATKWFILLSWKSIDALSRWHFTLSITVLECEGDTYGIGCKNCSDNCRNRKCKKYSETLTCEQGCAAGKTGTNCSMGKNNYYV